MLEKEIKILDVNREELVKKLIDLWAEKTFEWFIHDIYYDFVDGKNHKMDSNDRIFRIRKKWDIHLYTIKRKRNKKSEGWEDNLKVADEAESFITDIDSFTSVLEKYWMKKVREKKKHRVSFKLDGCEFDIDKYEEIPELMEIEAKTEEEIETFIKKLWLEANEKRKFGSRWLFEYYWKKYLYIKIKD